MILKLFKKISEKKIIFKFNLLNNQVINLIIQICNERNPLHLKLGLNKYFFDNNIVAFEITYKQIIEELNKKKFELKLSEIIASKSKLLFNIGIILSDIHKKIIAHNLVLDDEIIRLFKSLMAALWRINAKVNAELQPGVIVPEQIGAEREEDKNTMFIGIKQLKTDIYNNAQDSYLSMRSILEDMEKILKLL